MQIWEYNWWYSFLRPVVDACTRASYRQLCVKGQIPQDGAVILAPNHTNTLMDALVILQTRRSATIFGARADIFRKPWANAALRFLRILPLTRERDGLHSVTDNYQTFEEVDGTLNAGFPFCLFPEGRHHTDRTILPITKGIARMAVRSASKRQTFIVPTGINYSHFFRYRGACELIFGEPIDVNALMAGQAEPNEQQLFQQIREEIKARLEKLVHPQALENPLGWRSLLMPLWPAAALLSLPLWLPAEVICHKIADKAFANTARYVVLLLLGPVFLLLLSVLFFCLLPWWLALALSVAFLPSYALFYDGLLQFRRGDK